ncbi:MAG: A24 family peptidase [Pseudodesulfovibrio sp.]|uniref:Peptidase A24A prepilin type IV n=1 Tax=Pseudodesulfovibrio aespoeensis (strain ATCC 700646 / DSM 10631 / Aspo-2) TaxID=643562 RepID=E6VYP2_PSEA9|nr:MULTISPECIES: A24 family peptidase [Pseudodesulfovibrio]MBU4192656.1 A24 family peptidase [Pseudomonadota bacterium]ADU63909.1 peptidase A24A prepilin type IV [Pseudodesulfovibrio aespoeensis Aspo-2]MBU4243588.1 A24 family peptidase [Pseudomonadota bacterium]MBU4378243.1 A24 family peptidase [Pseudomonadota bacterium]MBU4475424.1 A24 family peptidase [Pseudomonadota bacterium]
MDHLIATMLVAALAVATVTDIRRQRIYNWLTFPLILSGLAAHTLHAGLDGLLLSSGGFALGLGVMVVPFFLGLMGAGDVKLMAGVGAWLGAQAAFTAFLFTCLAGGFYAVVVLARHFDQFKAVLVNIWATFLLAASTRRFEYTPVVEAQSMPRLCYGVAIAVGTVAAMVVNVAQTGSVLAR